MTEAVLSSVDAPFFSTLLHHPVFYSNPTGYLGLLQWFVHSACAPRVYVYRWHVLTSRPASPRAQLDKLVGIAMLVAATVVFLYYTFWTLFMVSSSQTLDKRHLSRPAPAQDRSGRGGVANTTKPTHSPLSTRTTPSRTSFPLASGPSASPSSSSSSPPPSSAPSSASS